jgi:hypothetical protein
MSLYEFKLCSPDEQALIVWNDGKFIKERLDEPNKFLLYKIDDFFAEVWYQSHKNKIVSIRSFKRGKSLDTYFKLN